jgi:serine/threonine protein kinase
MRMGRGPINAPEGMLESGIRAAAPPATTVCLEPHTQLGTYQIVRLLGQGGMGEVYLAVDRPLNRHVAVKVLHEEAVEPHRRARFEHEARAASMLSHPNITHVYQFGETPDGRRYLAMEYVDGEPLDQRLLQPLPLDAALDMAIQLASALAAAHGAGIIHRDLKPANVIVRHDGVVKVLDFGLAKQVARPNGSAGPRSTASLPLTEPGAIAGTVDYMSPEQARGQAADARTDVWALGVVLYEMVAGRRPFEGATRADVQAAVLQAEPPAVPSRDPDRSPELQRIVSKALRKAPERRYQTMKDLLLDLEVLRADPPVRPRRGGRWRRVLTSSAVALVGVATLVATLRTRLLQPAPSPVPQRLSIELGADATLATTDAPFALSADGALLAFVARPAGRAAQLYIRRLDQLAAMPLSGTDGAATPCFSPDGQWLAFFADAKLKKVRVTGGAVAILADAPEPRGAWWAEDGTIVYAPHFRMGLMRVASSGGPAAPLTTLADGEISHRFPQVLPGGRAVLYTATTEVNVAAGATLVVQALPSGQRTIVKRLGYFGRYAASGHILYVQDDALFAMPFDPRRLEVTGPTRRSIEGVSSNPARGSAPVAASDTGILAYSRGRNLFDARPMVWMDRTGQLSPLRDQPAAWQNPEFSPDGRRIAMDIKADGHRDIHVYDWMLNVMTRITSESTNEEFPIWTSDGMGLVYRSFVSSADPSGFALVWKSADGTGAPCVLARSRTALKPGSWHPTRNVLAYTAVVAGRDEDVMILPLEGDRAAGWKPGDPRPFATGPARERDPRFSPDGARLLYSSNESEADQVYVQPFPGPGGRVILPGNSGGGSWSRARREMVFTTRVVDYVHALMVVPYRTEGRSFLVGKQRPWADGAATLPELSGYRMYALHPDGMRVAIAPPSDSDLTATHVTLVFNLFDDLRRNTPGSP